MTEFINRDGVAITYSKNYYVNLIEFDDECNKTRGPS